MIPIASVVWSNRSAIAPRETWSPSFSSRWTSIQYLSRLWKPRRWSSASWICSHWATMIEASWIAGGVGASIRYSTNVSAVSSMRSITSSSPLIRA